MISITSDEVKASRNPFCTSLAQESFSFSQHDSSTDAHQSRLVQDFLDGRVNILKTNHAHSAVPHCVNVRTWYTFLSLKLERLVPQREPVPDDSRLRVHNHPINESGELERRYQHYLQNNILAHNSREHYIIKAMMDRRGDLFAPLLRQVLNIPNDLANAAINHYIQPIDLTSLSKSILPPLYVFEHSLTLERADIRAYFQICPDNALHFIVQAGSFYYRDTDTSARTNLVLPGTLVLDFKVTKHRGYHLQHIAASNPILKTLFCAPEPAKLNSNDILTIYDSEGLLQLADFEICRLPTRRCSPQFVHHAPPVPAHLMSYARTFNTQDDSPNATPTKNKPSSHRLISDTVLLDSLLSFILSSVNHGDFKYLDSSLTTLLLECHQCLSQLKSDRSVSKRSLISVLLKLDSLLRQPLDTQTLEAYLETASIMTRHHLGKVVGGVLIAIASLFLMSVLATLALMSLGVLTPLPILGYILSQTALEAGLYCAGAALATTGILGGTILAKQGFNHLPTQKVNYLHHHLRLHADEIEQSVNDASHITSQDKQWEHPSTRTPSPHNCLRKMKLAYQIGKMDHEARAQKLMSSFNIARELPVALQHSLQYFFMAYTDLPPEHQQILRYSLSVQRFDLCRTKDNLALQLKCRFAQLFEAAQYAKTLQNPDEIPAIGPLPSFNALIPADIHHTCLLEHFDSHDIELDLNNLEQMAQQLYEQDHSARYETPMLMQMLAMSLLYHLSKYPVSGADVIDYFNRCYRGYHPDFIRQHQSDHDIRQVNTDFIKPGWFIAANCNTVFNRRRTSEVLEKCELMPEPNHYIL